MLKGIYPNLIHTQVPRQILEFESQNMVHTIIRECLTQE